MTELAVYRNPVPIVVGRVPIVAEQQDGLDVNRPFVFPGTRGVLVEEHYPHGVFRLLLFPDGRTARSDPSFYRRLSPLELLAEAADDDD